MRSSPAENRSSEDKVQRSKVGFVLSSSWRRVPEIDDIMERRKNIREREGVVVFTRFSIAFFLANFFVISTSDLQCFSFPGISDHDTLCSQGKM